METPDGDLRPSPTAQRLADSLRSGVSARLQPGEAVAPDEDLVRLTGAGNLDGVAAAARPNALAPIVRGGRRVLQALLRPWSAVQTAFNREVAGRLVEMAVRGRERDRRLTRIEQSLHLIESRLAVVETGRMGTSAPHPPRVWQDADVRALERMFVLGRLPAPPAAILTMGAARMARDLAACGYDVCAPDPDGGMYGRPSSAPSGDQFDVVLLPRPDAHADDASGSLRRPALLAEAARALKPHGRVLLTVDVADARDVLDTISRVFTLVDLVIATPDGDVRVLGGERLREGLREAIEAGLSPIVFLCAERLDAPGR